MKVSFFSNFLNHHQLPFCNEMFDVLGKEFKFIATEKIPQERLELGYEDMNDKYPYVIRSYESVKQAIKAREIGEYYDVVIIGDAPDIYIKERLKKNKLTFRYSERVFKNGYIHSLDPRNLISMWKLHTKYRNYNLRMLCASGYTACDMALFRAYPNKMYKWGYFPEVVKYNIDELLEKKETGCIKILWVARLIKFKHPEQVVRVAIFLKKQKINFKINIIGIGELEEQIKKLIKENKLEEEICLKGAMPPLKVRKYMEQANIFLLTSDYEEGWGAVLNEAMNSGCAIVASHAVGSVPFLISHMENGLIYQYGEDEDLNNKVLELCKKPKLRKKLGENAYKTLLNQWSPRNAAINFCKLSEALLKGNEITIPEGPGSKAEIIKQKDAYKCMMKKI